jgi:chlorophyll synthase
MAGVSPEFRCQDGPLRLRVCQGGFSFGTGAAIMAAALPDWRIITLAALYSIGAHGIMTLNDFKSIEGDKRMGVRSLPVQLGAANAALLACVVMAVPQMIVAGLLLSWGRPWHALAIVVSLLVQFGLMSWFVKAPRERAPLCAPR